MRIRVLDKRLLRTLSTNKLQFGAVTTVIFIGLLILTSLTNSSLNLASSLNEYYSSCNFADLFAEFDNVPVSSIQELADFPEVRDVQPRIVTDVRADVGRDVNPTLRLVSIVADQTMNQLHLQDGRLPDNPGERGIALLSKFVAANGLQVGDSIDLIIRGETFPLTITAVVDSPEFIYAIKDLKSMLPDDLNFGIGFVNMPLLQELLNLSGQANSATILLEPGASPEDTRDEIEKEFKGRGLKSIITRDDQVSHAFISQELEQLDNVSTAVPVMFLGIAALVIFMIIARMVEGDRTTIGILKAMGYGNGEILSHYVKLALLIGLIGSVAGIAAGFMLAGSMSRLYLMYFNLPLFETRVYYRFLFLGLFLTLLVCGGTGFAAARGVLAIVPAEAMRPPAPTAGRKNLMETWLPGLWQRLSFSWKLVLRSLFRGKRRFALAFAGVALTYGVILLSLYFFSFFDLIFVGQFDKMERYDYAISFERPVSPAVLPEIRSLARISTVEPFTEYPFQIKNGWRKENIVARALPRDTELYYFEDPDGYPVPLPASGIILSQQIAQSLGVQPGDTVELSSYATKGKEHSVVLRGVITMYVGSGMYMSLEQMERLTGEAGTYTGVILNSSDNIKGIFQGFGNVASVYSNTDLIEMYSEFLGMMIASISVMVLLGGLLGFAILFNTTSVSISERMREFSSLRVLGFSQQEVFTLVVRENLIALFPGLWAGIPLGRAMAAAIADTLASSELFYLPVLIPLSSYLYTAILVLLFWAVAMAAVWFRVRRVNFLEALSVRLT
ncbi:MAG: ABC transporter permease [bacterium]